MVRDANSQMLIITLHVRSDVLDSPVKFRSGFEIKSVTTLQECTRIICREAEVSGTSHSLPKGGCHAVARGGGHLEGIQPL